MKTEGPNHLIPVALYEEAPANSPSPAARERERVAHAMRDAGFDLMSIPAHWPRASSALATLRSIAGRSWPTPTILCGYVHATEDYEELFTACLRKNLVLVNSPTEYARCHSFALAYPLLRKLTPASVIVHTVQEVPAALERLGTPVFIKGAIQSRKDRGWKSCVANTIREAQKLVEMHLNSYAHAEGAAVIRELVPLKFGQEREDGFPLSREFRVILFRHEVVGLGYYWAHEDPLETLDPAEERIVRALAEKASRQLKAPFVAIDIAQRVDGAWTVIEPGDPQTAGFAKVDAAACFREIRGMLSGC